uniref:Uncharacterized protein n=1 Tax=Amphora coffeiformis TaxID=265554 RepID=A0A7S3P8L8_9STRA|mmetsp:Transcript_4584/g.9247  ORF Transcript_4584/g.9247 Transcript_4584/m.9247 type:complete len:162 (-) Transcript_4584:169-654(-)|eukprot:scaffold1221_cov207-Amphora_coffeaeformis.AAC.42
MNALSLLTRRVAIMAARRCVPVLGTQMTTAYYYYRTAVTATTARPTSAPPAFAVEAPDGSSDALLDAELHQVDDLIEHAAKFEDLAFVQDLHQQQDEAAKIFAVDAPDGEADDIHQEDLHAIEEVIEYAAAHEDKEFVRRGHELEEAVRKAMTKRQGFPDY